MHLKDPDGIGNAISEAVMDSLRKVEGLSDREQYLLAEGREEKLRDELRPWVEFGEYVKVEIDTEKRTARILSVADAE